MTNTKSDSVRDELERVSVDSREFDNMESIFELRDVLGRGSLDFLLQWIQQHTAKKVLEGKIEVLEEIYNNDAEFIVAELEDKLYGLKSNQ